MIVLQIHRLAHWLRPRHVPALPWLLESLNRIVLATVIPPATQIGRGVLLSYECLGTVIHRSAIIENEATIGAGVTFGGRSGQPGAPVIGRGAMIGTGAKVLGAVRVGAYASIGANAVVLQDIPDHAVAVGVPARVVRVHRPGEMPDYRQFP